MVTKELMKVEIDHLQEEYLEVVYKMIEALETPLIDFDNDIYPLPEIEQLEWEAFVDQYAGCLKEAPIERGEQGTYSIKIPSGRDEIL